MFLVVLGFISETDKSQCLQWNFIPSSENKYALGKYVYHFLRGEIVSLNLVAVYKFEMYGD